MSQIRMETVRCPECGNRQEFRAWESVSSDDQALVSELLRGKLFEFRCGKCGCTAEVRYSMLYSDMEHGRFIWLVSPEEKRQKENEIRSFDLPGIRQMIVTSPEQLADAVRSVNIADHCD